MPITLQIIIIIIIIIINSVTARVVGAPQMILEPVFSIVSCSPLPSVTWRTPGLTIFLSHGNEVLPQDTTHLIQRPCCQQGSPCQDPAAIGPHEDLLTIVKRLKLQWYGHVSRSSVLAKTILQGTVKGRRRQGRQRKRWEDNIREWTGLEFGKSQRAVEKKWRKLVAKSSVVPQRPSRLRD